MSKVVKQRWAVLMALVLVVSLVISACGSKNDNGNTNGNASSGTNTGSQSKPVELIWYTIGAPQKDLSKVVAEINKYTSEKIGVTVNMKMIDYGEYTEKMQVNATAGTPMDILFTSSWAFDYVQNARKGAFMPLNDLLEEHGQGIVEALDPAFLEGSKVDGVNYGIPANKELPAQEVWRFNKNLLDKYELDISEVRSMESLEPLLAKIKANEPTVVPFAISKDFMPLMPFDYLIEKLPMAVYLDTTDYKIVNILETPELKQALDTMHKYYKAGYIPAEAATSTSVADIQLAGLWFTDRASTQPFADNVWSASYQYPVISTPAGDPVVFNWSVMGSMQAISANSKHPEKAMEFLNLLNTDPYLRNLVDSGIENVHYKKLSENVMENLPESSNYDMPTFSLGNLMITYLNPNDPEDKWEKFKEFNASGTNAPLLGFNFNSSKVTTELANVQNIKDEFWPSLMTGSVNPDEYLPKAIERLKSAGLDTIIAEAQAQLDEFIASKK